MPSGRRERVSPHSNLLRPLASQQANVSARTTLRGGSATVLAALAFVIPAATAAFTKPTTAAPEVPVRMTAASELRPVAGNGFLAWAQNSRRRPNHFDVYAQRGNGLPFKVNPPETQGLPGGIFGNTLVYEESGGKAKGGSDIRLYNLVTRKRRNTPPRVNTRLRESRPSLSRQHLLFNRAGRRGEAIILYDFRTGRQIVLDREPRRRGVTLLSDQVRGDYAVWTNCRGACFVSRYEIDTGRSGRLSGGAIPEAQSWAGSVTATGTVYFLKMTGMSCQYTETRLARSGSGREEEIRRFPEGQWVASTSAVIEEGQTSVYYARGPCGTLRGYDIYRVVVNHPSRT